MTDQPIAAPELAVCIDNSGYPASLDLHKSYRVIPDSDAQAGGDLRVMDESGEDYLCSATRFLAIVVPVEVRRSMVRAT